MVLWMAEGDAYALLGALLAREHGLAELPGLARDENGKPFFPDRPDLCFNLSHSGGLALCGAGRGPLGVDIERVRPRRAGLFQHVLSTAEQAWFRQHNGDWELFYTLWTLKEAKVKCTGRGLRQAPRTIAVPMLLPGQAGELDGLRFRAYGGPGWRAAACCAGPELPPPEIVSFS